MGQKAQESSNTELSHNYEHIRERSKKLFWFNKFVEFCKRTDFHGYKYIVMEEFSYSERICWAMAVLLSMTVAAYFVATVYNWYAINPTIRVIESTQGAIWDIPFPAVTICDLNIVSKKAARELSENLTLPVNVTTESVFKSLRLIPLIYTAYKTSSKEKADLNQLQSILDINNITIDSLFKLLSPTLTCNHLLQKCMWKNTLYRCDKLFKHISTLPGECCTFNYYAIGDKEGDKLSPRLSTPRRVASCGYQTALTVLMYSDLNDYYSATVATQGVLVIIDGSYNVPDLDSPVRMVNPSTEVLIALSPEITYTTAGIKRFSPEVRQCYYSNEIHIENFRQYSFHNCMWYQKIIILKTTCNCVPHFFPVSDNYRFCNFKDMECMANVWVQPANNQKFHCLPECEYYNYPMEVALGKLTNSVYASAIPFFADVQLTNRSLLNVFFNDLVSTMYRRDVYLSWQNILSSFGGLLSLMIGFTLISGLDLILFLVVRVGLYSLSWMFKKSADNKIYVNEHRTKEKRMQKEKDVAKYEDDNYNYRRY